MNNQQMKDDQNDADQMTQVQSQQNVIYQSLQKNHIEEEEEQKQEQQEESKERPIVFFHDHFYYYKEQLIDQCLVGLAHSSKYQFSYQNNHYLVIAGGITSDFLESNFILIYQLNQQSDKFQLIKKITFYGAVQPSILHYEIDSCPKDSKYEKGVYLFIFSGLSQNFPLQKMSLVMLQDGNIISDKAIELSFHSPTAGVNQIGLMPPLADCFISFLDESLNNKIVTPVTKFQLIPQTIIVKNEGFYIVQLGGISFTKSFVNIINIRKIVNKSVVQYQAHFLNNSKNYTINTLEQLVPLNEYPNICAAFDSFTNKDLQFINNPQEDQNDNQEEEEELQQDEEQLQNQQFEKDKAFQLLNQTQEDYKKIQNSFYKNLIYIHRQTADFKFQVTSSDWEQKDPSIDKIFEFGYYKENHACPLPIPFIKSADKDFDTRQIVFNLETFIILIDFDLKTRTFETKIMFRDPLNEVYEF